MLLTCSLPDRWWQMAMYAGLPVAALTLVACGEVRVEPSASDGATTAGATSAAGPTGAGGDGPVTSAGPTGAGGDGGSETSSSAGGGGASTGPAPVPGCEELVWVGEPVVVHVGPWPTPRVATFDDGDVGIFVADRDHPEGHSVMHWVIPRPFAAWPPAVGEPVAVLRAANGDFSNEDPRLSARSDGAYTVSVPSQPTGVTGRMGAPPDGLVFEGHLTLLPAPGSGAYATRWGEDGVALERFASVAAGARSTPVGLLPPTGCWDPRAITTADGTFLVAAGVSPYCEKDTSITIIRADDDGIATAATVAVSEDVWQHELVPRPGGAWLLVVETDHVTATALAGDGTPLGAPWIGVRDLPTDHVAAAPWRDGFAIAEFAHVGDEHGTRVRVSDGVHETTIAPRSDDGAVVRGIGVTASADGRSLLVAHEVGMDLWIQRADCVAVAPSP